MNGYLDIYLLLTVTMTSIYNGWLPYQLLTMDGYNNIYIRKWNVTITSTYNGWLP
jgi:hypothetical protein